MKAEWWLVDQSDLEWRALSYDIHQLYGIPLDDIYNEH